MLDNLIPQHDAHTTAAWIAFAEELADGVKNAFEREATSLGRGLSRDLRAIRSQSGEHDLSDHPCTGQRPAE